MAYESGKQGRLILSRIAFVVILMLAASVTSILSQLVLPSKAYAATSAEIEYCVSTFKSGDIAASAAGYSKDFDKKHCADVCKTSTSDRTGITKVESCDPNTVPSDLAQQKTAATDKVIIDGYTKAVCDSDTTCISKATPCIETYLKNGYKDSNAPEYPEVDIAGFSSCIAKATGKSEKTVTNGTAKRTNASYCRC